MSAPFSPSKHTSPVSSVRSSTAPVKSNHVSGTTSPSKPKAITSITSIQHVENGRDDHVVSDNDGTQEQSSDLGNHDGKAWDDVGSDPNTPRLAPFRNGSGDLQNLRQEEIVQLDQFDQKSLHVLSSSIESSKHHFPAFWAPDITFSSSISEPGSRGHEQSLTHSQQTPRSNKSHGDTRIVSWLEESHKLDFTPFAKPAILPHNIRTHLHRPSTQIQMSEINGREGEQNPGVTAREEAFGEKRNRSSSRNDQKRMEKRIEATLADAEPSSHARSRKSSHTLGLFKETAASQGLHSRRDRARTISDNESDSSVTARPLLDEDKAKYDHHGHLTSNLGIQDNKIEEESLSKVLEQDFHVPEDKKTSYNLQQPLQPLHSTSLSEPSGRHGTEVRSPSNVGDGSPPNNETRQSSRSGAITKEQIPPRLLEEIKSQHNLTTPLQEKFRSPQLDPAAQILDKEKPEVVTCSKEDATTEAGERKVYGKVTDEENEDEESEHISSILYNPHQAPSPDALVDVSIDDARKTKEASIDSNTQLPEPALPPVDDVEDTEDVDIALQIHNKNRYFHGDLSKSKQTSTETEVKQAPESGFSSASESDYESQDENRPLSGHEDSSLTDDAEATPRASPNTRRSYLASRSRKSRRDPVAPLVAVELKPYNHQVGGHSKVFRFSKRAVCKQLSNRENEFYEVVERLHPELLKFLPKYVFRLLFLAARVSQSSL